MALCWRRRDRVQRQLEPRPACHWSDEAVTAARHGFDESGVLGGVADGCAQLPNGRIQRVVKFDKRLVRPKLLTDLFAGDNFAGSLQQERKDLKRLPLQTNS
jgi:hypothetical protein